VFYKLALLLASLGVSIACASRADSIPRYWQWQNLDQKAKAFYAAGLMDSGIMMLILSSASSDAQLSHEVVVLTNCIQYNRLNDHLLADMIDDAYTKEPKRWNIPPSEILQEEITARIH
jgi:hypothetical protein